MKKEVSHSKIRNAIFSSNKSNKVPSHLCASPQRPKKIKHDQSKHSNNAMENYDKKSRESMETKILITETLCQTGQDNQEVYKKEYDDKGNNEGKKHSNDVVKKKCPIKKKLNEVKHMKIRGVEKRYKESSDSGFNNTEARIKNKAEKVRREGRKAVVSETRLHSKSKSKHNSKSEEKSKSKKSPVPQIISYAKQRKKIIRVSELRGKLEDAPKEIEFINALSKLDKTNHKHFAKKKKRKRSKSHFKLDREKSAYKTIFSSERKEKYLTSYTDDTYRENSEEHRQAISEKLKRLKERVAYTQSLLKAQAAITIQRWFRANRQRFKSNYIKCYEDSLEYNSKYEHKSGNLVDLDAVPIICQSKSEFVESFDKVIKESTLVIESNTQIIDNIEIRENEIVNKNAEIFNKNSEIVDHNKNCLEAKADSSVGVKNTICTEFKEQRSNNLTPLESTISEKSLEMAQAKPKIVYKVPAVALETIKSRNSRDMDCLSKHSQNSIPHVYYQPHVSRESLKAPVTSNADSDSQRRSLESYILETSNSQSIIDETSKSLNSKSSYSSKSSANIKNFNSKYPNLQPKPNLVPETQNSLPISSIRQESPKNIIENLKIEDSSSEVSSGSQNSEAYLQNILSRDPPAMPNKVIERPGIMLIEDPESSDEEWSRDFNLYPIINIQSQPQDEKNKIIDSSQSEYVNNFDIKFFQLIQDEIKLFLDLIPFNTIEKPVNPTKYFIEDYIDKFEKALAQDEENILELINTPFYIDPLTKMEMLQTIEIGSVKKYAVLELFLPQSLTPELKRIAHTQQFREQSTQDSQEFVKYQSTYLQMLYDCINESFNHLRPFGLKGLPDPWSYIASTLYGEGDLKTVMQKSKKLLLRWENVHIGAYPDGTSNSNDEKLQKIREERLRVMLSQNVNDDESGWTSYEDEETQVKIDISDLVLDIVVDETVEIIKQDPSFFRQ